MKPGLRLALRFAERGFAVLGVLTLVYHGACHLSVIRSPSMAPTLADSDWVLTEKVSYRFRDPRRFELVHFQDSDGINIMKRVMGLPGETLAVQGTELQVGGSTLALPAALGFLKYYPYGSLSPGRSAESGRGYFVLGDDSRDSQDSRFEGPLDRERILGRPWLRVWPASRIGFVNP